MAADPIDEPLAAVLPRLSDETVVLARSLPEAPNRYFLPDDRSSLIDCSLLRMSRARPEGITNGAVLMSQAYEGATRRAPVDVEPLGDGFYRVVDGNSTVAIARIAGWKTIPVRIRDHAEATGGI